MRGDQGKNLTIKFKTANQERRIQFISGAIIRWIY